MRRKLTVISALLLAIMLSFSMIQPTYAASSKKPAAPKITSATVNGNSITITWKKAKNAKKYEVWYSTKAKKGFKKNVLTESANTMYDEYSHLKIEKQSEGRV